MLAWLFGWLWEPSDTAMVGYQDYRKSKVYTIRHKATYLLITLVLNWHRSTNGASFVRRSCPIFGVADGTCRLSQVVTE